MKGDPQFVVLKYTTWLDASEYENRILGAVVKEFLKPEDAFVPRSGSPLQYNDQKLSERTFSNFVVDSSGSSGHDADVSLKLFAGYNLNASADDIVKLKGKIVRYKKLIQHDQFWTKLKEDKDVKSTVPGWISVLNTWPVCLVVGIMICDEVDFSFETKQTLKREGNIEVPVGAITLAAGVPNPLGDTGNPQVKVSTHKTETTTFKAKSGQSQIFALELKKITTKHLKWKELVLKGTGPKVDDGRLLGADDDDEEDDEDSVTVGDLLCEELSPEELAEMAECS